MFEYAVVNFCSTNYKTTQQQIDDTINNIRTNLSKYKKKLIKKLNMAKDSRDGTPVNVEQIVIMGTEEPENLNTEVKLIPEKKVPSALEMFSKA